MWESKVLVSISKLGVSDRATKGAYPCKLQLGYWLPTFDADVAGFQISAEVACARERVVGQTVNDGRDTNIASPSAGTPGVKLLPDVPLTAEVAVVDRQTATEPHATVMRGRYEQHLVIRLTTSAECLTLAVFAHLTICCRHHTTASVMSHMSQYL